MNRSYFDQWLDQAEIALCLSALDNFHIVVWHLIRRLSGLQLLSSRTIWHPWTCSQFHCQTTWGTAVSAWLQNAGERFCLNGLRPTRDTVRDVCVQNRSCSQGKDFLLKKTCDVEITRKQEGKNNHAWPLRSSVEMSSDNSSTLFITITRPSGTLLTAILKSSLFLKCVNNVSVVTVTVSFKNSHHQWRGSRALPGDR